MHRLFVALPIPEENVDFLLDRMDEGDALRWVEADHLHLTLRFIGEVNGRQAEDLAAALKSVSSPPFKLALSGAGSFVHRRHGALWAGASPREPVAALAARIERAVQATGLPAETRAFHPHVTLARWSGKAPDLGPFLRRHADLASPPWQVESFSLMESRLGRHGALYSTAATYPLS